MVGPARWAGSAAYQRRKADACTFNAEWDRIPKCEPKDSAARRGGAGPAGHLPAYLFRLTVLEAGGSTGTISINVKTRCCLVVVVRLLVTAVPGAFVEPGAPGAPGGGGSELSSTSIARFGGAASGGMFVLRTRDCFMGTLTMFGPVLVPPGGRTTLVEVEFRVSD